MSKDIISSLFLIVCSALIVSSSIRFPLGGVHNPGPGFLPLWVGILMLFLSIVLFCRSLLNNKKRGAVKAFSPKNIFKILGTFLTLLVYVPVFSHLGFLLATIPLTVFLFKAIGEKSWKISLLGGIIATLVMYLVFKVLLQIQFPVGLIEV